MKSIEEIEASFHARSERRVQLIMAEFDKAMRRTYWIGAFTMLAAVLTVWVLSRYMPL